MNSLLKKISGEPGNRLSGGLKISRSNGGNRPIHGARAAVCRLKAAILDET
jgi:hypothetical protein